MAGLVDGGGSHEAQTTTRHPINGVDRNVRARPASILSKKIRAPCQDCNSGWMNRTEATARPFLEKMIAGDAVHLLPINQLAVAKWIAMKVMVAEHADRELAVTTPGEKRLFMETGQIPGYFRIYVGSHVSKSDTGYVRASTTASLFGPIIALPSLDGMRRNVEQVTFLMGRLFVHVNAARLDGFFIEDRILIPIVHDEMRIWPLQHPAFKFPRGPILSDFELGQVSDSWNAIANSERTIWGGDLPVEAGQTVIGPSRPAG